MIGAVFLKLCPNCGGKVSSYRLLKGLPCEKCLPKELDRDEICSFLTEGNLSELCNINKKVRRWERLFKKVVGTKPWSLQRSWAKKVFLGRSFALLAPTGVGKTTFGLVTALLLAKERKKSYIILPTKLLLKQVENKLRESNLKEEDLLVVFGASSKEREKAKERIVKGNFKILVTTSMYLYKNYAIIPREFSFIFIDDVDSFLKNSRNIYKVLYLLGFSQEDIEIAQQLIRIKEKRKKTEKDWELIRDTSSKVRELTSKAKGVLVVSSATGNPKSGRIKLFRELLGFEAGKPTFNLRNVLDLYEIPSDLEETLLKRVKELGKGGLIFVSADKGKAGVEKVTTLLKKEGIKAKSYEEIKDISSFESGEIDILVGISSFKNPLVRGLDIPYSVRYALFFGVPKITISLNIETGVFPLLWLLLSLRSLLAKKLPYRLREVDRWIRILKKHSYISEDFIEMNPDLKKRINNLKEEVKNFLLLKEVKRIIEESEEISLEKTPQGFSLSVADVTGYLQASGRTSRIYAGGVSLGLSYVLVDNKKTFNNLARKIKWFNEEIRFTPSSEANLKEILVKVDKDRKRIKKLLEGEEKGTVKDHVKPVLLVVESPTKARTIASFFGKPVTRRVEGFDLMEVSAGDIHLLIASSFGHVLDISKEGGFHGIFVENGNFLPFYEPLEGKEKTLTGLRLVAQEVDSVYIATDPDTEGEKIGWDICAVLSPYVKEINRIEFHEVTRKAVKKALEEPKNFNENLVKAQIVRRISDRWIGFEVSRILQTIFGKLWLSGGRVQIPVLGWIIEREKLYRKRRHIVVVNIKEADRRLRIDFEFANKKEAKAFFENLDCIEVEVLKEREEYLTPPPPYTTDTMLKEANEKFRWSVRKTMELAQDLFEKGLITYHRTDATRVSSSGISVAVEYITETWNSSLIKPRQWSSEGAHECIRPTRPIDAEELRSVVYSGQIQDINTDHLRLYDLIFRRFIASQMESPKVKIKQVRIKAFNKKTEIVLRTEILKEGYDCIYPVELQPDLAGKINVSDKKEIREMPKAYLFTQGSLVEEMKKRGIGRPSTYATTVEKLLERGYVIERKGFLIPTKLGKQVYEFLRKQEDIIPFLSEDFTRKLENIMDRIEEGKENYEDILRQLHRDIIKFESVLRR